MLVRIFLFFLKPVQMHKTLFGNFVVEMSVSLRVSVGSRKVVTIHEFSVECNSTIKYFEQYRRDKSCNYLLLSSRIREPATNFTLNGF